MLIGVSGQPIKLARYMSIAFTERLAAAGTASSIGIVGDPLAEFQIGLFKS